MRITFKSNKREWHKLTKDEMLAHYSLFLDFMCMYEEEMTFSEADRYYKKMEQLREYIIQKFKIDPDGEMTYEATADEIRMC